MTLVKKIVVTILSMVLSSPFFPYYFFPKLIRKCEKYEKKVSNFDEFVFIAYMGIIVTVIMPVAIAITVFQNEREAWYIYLVPIAYGIGWQLVWTCVIMKRKLLPIVLPILVIAFIFCICMSIRDLILAIC